MAAFTVARINTVALVGGRNPLPMLFPTLSHPPANPSDRFSYTAADERRTVTLRIYSAFKEIYYQPPPVILAWCPSTGPPVVSVTWASVCPAGNHKRSNTARSSTLRSHHAAVPFTHQHKRAVLQGRRTVTVRAETQPSSQPLQTKDGRTVYISDSDDYMPDQAELVASIKARVAELLKMGEKQSMINTCVAGTYNDTKQLLLYQQVQEQRG
eukprot:1186344-Pyramimonas_sp.AAC.1